MWEFVSSFKSEPGLTELPIIDLGAVSEATKRKDSEASEILKLKTAMTEIGFFYLVGHEIKNDVVPALEKEFFSFFAKDDPFKLQIKMENYGKIWRGFFPVGAELTAGIPDDKEGLYLGPDYHDSHPEVIKGTPTFGQNQWPNSGEFQNLKKRVQIYIQHLEPIAEKLLDGVGLSIGLKADYLRTTYSSPPTLLLRAFHYPPIGKGCYFYLRKKFISSEPVRIAKAVFPLVMMEDDFTRHQP